MSGALPYPWVAFDASDSMPMPRTPRLHPHPLPPISRPKSSTGTSSRSVSSGSASSASSDSSGSRSPGSTPHYDIWSSKRSGWLSDAGSISTSMSASTSASTSRSASDTETTPPSTPPAIYLDLDASTLAAEVALEVLKTEDVQECPFRVCPSGENLDSPFKPTRRGTPTTARYPLHSSSVTNALGLDLYGEDSIRTPTKRQRSVVSDDGQRRKRPVHGLQSDEDNEDDHPSRPLLVSCQTTNCRDLLRQFGLVPQSTAASCGTPARGEVQPHVHAHAAQVQYAPSQYYRHPYPINPRLGHSFAAPSSGHAQVPARARPQSPVQPPRPWHTSSSHTTHRPPQQAPAPPVHATQVANQPTYGWYSKRGGGPGYTSTAPMRQELAPSTYTFNPATARRRPHRHSHAPPHAPQARIVTQSSRDQVLM